MIEILNGIHETVDYDAFHGIRLYDNVEIEDYPIHWHTALEIIMPLSNSYTVVIDGEAHLMEEGDIWITAPGTLHALKAPASGERIILLFDYSMICNVKGMDSLLHTFHPYRLISKKEFPELNNRLSFYIEEVRKEYESPTSFTEASIYALMIRFFIAMGRHFFDAGSKFPGINVNKQHEYVEKFLMICNYISDHCTENLSINELANLAGYSKFHFSRLFKQFTNMSCYEYLIQKRIAYAEQLLIQPDLSITEVAMQSGFNSLSTFNRTFKEEKGCTPSAYKNLNRTTQKSLQKI